MTLGRCAVLLLSFLWTRAQGDVSVTCTFNHSCILPCSSAAPDVVHWHRMPGEVPVHKYFDGRDQADGSQDGRYRGRTSLVGPAEGRASLRLDPVQVQDQAQYQCYTSNDHGWKKSLVHLTVSAPVLKVQLVQEGNSLRCSSEGIYPEPGLTWTPEPPPGAAPLGGPSTRQSAEQLYSISGALDLSGSDQNRTYSCNISSATNWRTSTLRQTMFLTEKQVELPCSTFNASFTDFSVFWTFNGSESVANRSAAQPGYLPSRPWRPRVRDVTESGRLVLQDLTSDQTGRYRCELVVGPNSLTTETTLRIIQDCCYCDRGIIPAAVVVLLVLLSVSAALYWCKCRRKRRSTRRPPERLTQ